MVTSGISWCKQLIWVGWCGLTKECDAGVGLGGEIRNNASFEIKNNVKLIMETLGWAGGYLYKAER